MQIQFGARATAGQAVAAQELARKLYDEETARNARPEMTFFKHVQGLRDFGNTVKEVGTDGDILNTTIEKMKTNSELPKEGNVDVLYFWRFPSKTLARLGEGAVKFFIAKRKGSLADTSVVRRDGDKLLLRTRVEAQALNSEG